MPSDPIRLFSKEELLAYVYGDLQAGEKPMASKAPKKETPMFFKQIHARIDNLIRNVDSLLSSRDQIWFAISELGKRLNGLDAAPDHRSVDQMIEEVLSFRDEVGKIRVSDRELVAETLGCPLSVVDERIDHARRLEYQRKQIAEDIDTND